MNQLSLSFGRAKTWKLNLLTYGCTSYINLDWAIQITTNNIYKRKKGKPQVSRTNTNIKTDEQQAERESNK